MVEIYNADSLAHHIVSTTSNWSIDVVLQPGQAVYPAVAGYGWYGFRNADSSGISFGRCYGSCAAVSVNS